MFFENSFRVNLLYQFSFCIALSMNEKSSKGLYGSVIWIFVNALCWGYRFVTMPNWPVSVRYSYIISGTYLNLGFDISIIANIIAVSLAPPKNVPSGYCKSETLILLNKST
jgi:hypothetical protein